jgi:hypothetical protein
MISFVRGHRDVAADGPPGTVPGTTAPSPDPGRDPPAVRPCRAGCPAGWAARWRPRRTHARPDRIAQQNRRDQRHRPIALNEPRSPDAPPEPPNDRPPKAPRIAGYSGTVDDFGAIEPAPPVARSSDFHTWVVLNWSTTRPPPFRRPERPRTPPNTTPRCRPTSLAERRSHPKPQVRSSVTCQIPCRPMGSFGVVDDGQPTPRAPGQAGLGVRPIEGCCMTVLDPSTRLWLGHASRAAQTASGGVRGRHDRAWGPVAIGSPRSRSAPTTALTTRGTLLADQVMREIKRRPKRPARSGSPAQTGCPLPVRPVGSHRLKPVPRGLVSVAVFNLSCTGPTEGSDGCPSWWVYAPGGTSDAGRRQLASVWVRLAVNKRIVPTTIKIAATRRTRTRGRSSRLERRWTASAQRGG